MTDCFIANRVIQINLEGKKDKREGYTFRTIVSINETHTHSVHKTCPCTKEVEDNTMPYFSYCSVFTFGSTSREESTATGYGFIMHN